MVDVATSGGGLRNSGALGPSLVSAANRLAARVSRHR